MPDSLIAPTGGTRKSRTAHPAKRPTKLINHNVQASSGRTSVRLEAEFWDVLRAEADAAHATVSDLVREAERAHPRHKRTSAVRVWVLRRLMDRASTPEGETTDAVAP